MRVRKPTPYWTMKDGTKIAIRKMSDSHLANTIALLERHAQRAHAQEERLLLSASFFLQGEMAMMEADREMDRLLEEGSDGYAYRHPSYEALIEEQTRRELRRTTKKSGPSGLDGPYTWKEGKKP